MKREVILLIIIGSIFLIALIFLGIYSLFRKKENGFEVIQDEEKIRKILLDFEDNPILEVYNKNNCSQDYMILTKITKYKTKPGNKEYKEEIFTKITRVEYYKKQK